MTEESAAPAPEKPKKDQRSRRRLVLWSGIGIGVLVLAAAIGFFVLRGSSTPAASSAPPAGSDPTRAVTLVPRAIDGVLDVPENERLYPIGIMVENLSTVRPQAGLENAHVIYEALAEGGITRFLAIYTLLEPIERIGPIRSARPYHLDWVKEYNALYGHVGGSPEAMVKIPQYEILDLDQFFNAPYYWRDDKIERPHNVFTATKFLTFAERDKGVLDQKSAFTPWTFKEESPLADRPEGEQKITIDYSTFSYRVEWVYDRPSNGYQRSHGDVPHVSLSGAQHAAKNVIVQYVKTSVADAGRLKMETIGEGAAIVFRDGQAISAIWKKPSREARTVFEDADGTAIALNAGQTWVEIVPTDRTVDYTGKPAAP